MRLDRSLYRLYCMRLSRYWTDRLSTMATSYSGALSLTQAPPPPEVDELELEHAPILRKVVLSFFASVFLGVMLCVAYLTQRTMSHAPQPGVAAAAKVDARKAEAPANWIVVLAPPPPAPLPDSSSPFAAEMAAAAPAPSAAPLKLVMSATEDAWVEVETDGHVTFAKLVRAEQTVSFEAVNRIRMSTGNALGLAIRFNGEPVRLTSARRVRTIEFTSDGPREPEAVSPATKS